MSDKIMNKEPKLIDTEASTVLDMAKIVNENTVSFEKKINVIYEEIGNITSIIEMLHGDGNS